MHRVQVPEITPEMLLGAQETRHLHVLRLRPGERVQVFDGRGGQAEAAITLLDDTRAVLTRQHDLRGSVRGAEYPQPVTLAISLLKGDKLAEVVRAATELGVRDLRLLVCRHADAREIGAQKLQRLERIASEAARQSERSVTPVIHPPVPLKDFTWTGTLLTAHPGSSHIITEFLHWQEPLTLLSGPEGGLSDAEVTHLTERGAHLVNLGPRILRAETAPIAMLGAIAATGV